MSGKVKCRPCHQATRARSRARDRGPKGPPLIPATVPASDADDDDLSLLREAAAIVEPERLSHRAYNAIARERGWETGESIRRRYGSWNEALARARLPARRYSRRVVRGRVVPCTQCGDPPYARGFCVKHYLGHMAVYGADYLPRNVTGYVWIGVAGQSKTRVEHRVVMEAIIGRDLLPGETIHHKGARHDNRLHMLELKVKAHGVGWTVDEALAWAREIITRYG